MKSDEPVYSSIQEELKWLRARVSELEPIEQERNRIKVELDECMHLATLTSDISIALIQNNTLQESLQQCTQALITHLGAAFARIWTLNAETQILELQASAGIYTHLDGTHSRIPVGMYKIGLIASERQPHLTNTVIGDERVSDQEWAKREGMIAFAGYPLIIEEELVGVMAIFARTPLSSAVLDAMASVSNAIALGIERKRMEEERAYLLVTTQQSATQAEAERVRLAHILDHLTDGFMIFDEQWRYSYINPQAEPYTGKPWQELLGKIVWEEFPELIGSLYYQKYHHAMLHQEPVAFELFASTLAGWFDIHAYPIPHGLAIYFRNITERKQAEEERIQLLEAEQRAHSEAEAALQIRNDFLSSISHDLKTPLAVMRGNVQLFQHRLKRGITPDGAWSMNRLAMIEASITKMTGMVDDLLDVAKLQAGQKLDLEMRPFSLLPLIQRIRTEQQETTKRHQIVLEEGTLQEEVFVRGDQIRLDRVFTNLLANAIKYNPPGGQITIRIRPEEIEGQQWIAIHIQDQGIGIPSTDLPHIFDPFYRASNVTRHIQGTGVGLASSAQVIAEHGGNIGVSSEEGQGSTFVVRLPCFYE